MADGHLSHKKLIKIFLYQIFIFLFNPYSDLLKKKVVVKHILWSQLILKDGKLAILHCWKNYALDFNET